MAVNNRGDIETVTKQFLSPNQMCGITSSLFGLQVYQVNLEPEPINDDDTEFQFVADWRDNDTIGVTFTLSANGTEIYINDCENSLDLQAVDAALSELL